MGAQTLHLNWHNPVQIHFGTDTLSRTEALERVVVLVDPLALGDDGCARLRAQLGARCTAWRPIETGLATIDQAARHCEKLWPVLQQHPRATVLAIGGGTTLDLAKVLRWRLPGGSYAQCLQAWRSNTLPSNAVRHTLWVAPTTAGTGSEVTRSATLWDTEDTPACKRSWAPADGFADVALVDPLLTLRCPSSVTRDCALDSLAHALEALWNHQATAWTNGMAVQAARDILASLAPALAAPHDVALRTALSHASLMAGMAMSQTQTALAHALSYRLTLEEGMPHGQACAVWLPMVWEIAIGRSTACDAALAQVFTPPVPSGPQALRQWLRGLGITPRDLRTNAQGLHDLQSEMASARGRNFIGSSA